MEPRVFHVVRPRPPPTAPAVSPGVTLSCCVQRCPLPVFPVRDHGALLTLNGAAPLSSPSGAPRPRWSSRDGDAPAELSGGEPGGRWRPGSTDPIPEPELRTRCRRWGSRWGAECQTAAEPWGRSAARAQPGGAGGGPCPGKAGGSPSGRGPGSARAALSGPPRLRSRVQRGGNGGRGGAAGCPEAAGSGAAPRPPQQFPRWHRGSSAGHLRTRPAPPCSVRNRARPVPPRPGSGAVRCGAGSGVFGTVRAAAGRGATRNCPGFSCLSRRGAGPERARRGAARGPRPGIGSAFGGGGDFAVTGGGCHLPRGFPTCRRPIKAGGSAGGGTDPIRPDPPRHGPAPPPPARTLPPGDAAAARGPLPGPEHRLGRLQGPLSAAVAAAGDNEGVAPRSGERRDGVWGSGETRDAMGTGSTGGTQGTGGAPGTGDTQGTGNALGTGRTGDALRTGGNGDARGSRGAPGTGSARGTGRAGDAPGTGGVGHGGVWGYCDSLAAWGEPRCYGVPVNSHCQSGVRLGGEEDMEGECAPHIRCSDACDPSTLDTNSTVPEGGVGGSLRGPGGIPGAKALGVLWGAWMLRGCIAMSEGSWVGVLGGGPGGLRGAGGPRSATGVRGGEGGRG